MIEVLKKIGYKNLIFGLLVLVSLGFLTFYLFFCGRSFFHSDMAGETLLIASEQIRTGELFPEGWHNKTMMSVSIWELILIPLMNMISDWLLCREIMVFIECCLLIACIYLLSKCISKKWIITGGLGVIFLSFPLGHYTQCVYEAAYTGIVIFILLTNLLIIRLLDTRTKSQNWEYCLLGLTIFLSGYGNLRAFLILMLPAVLSVVLYYWIEYREKCILQMKKEKGHITLIAVLIFCLITYCTYCYTSKTQGIAGTGMFHFTSAIVQNFTTFIQSLFSMYGASGDFPILSFGGLRICSNFVFMILSTLVAPLYFLIHYKKIQNRAVKLFILFAWISDFTVVFMMIFSTATTDRYYTTVFFHNIIFLALLIENLAEKVKEDVKWIVTVLLICLVCINHVSYCKTTVADLKFRREETKKTGTLVDFLKKNNLKYGVASFWNAWGNMCRSNGDIMIVGCLSNAEKILSPQLEYYWGCSEYWYNPDNYQGRSFILLAEGETVSDTWRSMAIETKTFKNYTILIYDKNIYSYDIAKKGA